MIVDTVAFAGAPDARFFQANVPGGAGQVSFAWLAADGTELDTAVAQTVQADVQAGPTTSAAAGG